MTLKAEVKELKQTFLQNVSAVRPESNKKYST